MNPIYLSVEEARQHLNGWHPLPRVKNPDGSLRHVYCEGSRQHVIVYSTQGMHCSEPECEINSQSAPC